VAGDVSDVSDRIVLGRGARVGGDLNYGDERPIVAPGAVVGGETKKFDVGDAFRFRDSPPCWRYGWPFRSPRCCSD
jgi:hypothetical protein